MQIVCFIYLATDLRSIYFKSVTIVSSFTRLGTYANVYQGFSKLRESANGFAIFRVLLLLRTKPDISRNCTLGLALRLCFL